MKCRIVVDEGRLHMPLRPVEVGRLSSYDACVDDVPADADSLMLVVDRVGDGVPSAVPCHMVRPGRWECYMSPWVFPEAGTVDYHVLAYRGGVPLWLGSGVLTIRECPAGGSPVPPPIVPADTYVRNPVTGLYHKVCAEVDEYGAISLTVDEEGVPR